MRGLIRDASCAAGLLGLVALMLIITPPY